MIYHGQQPVNYDSGKMFVREHLFREEILGSCGFHGHTLKINEIVLDEVITCFSRCSIANKH